MTSALTKTFSLPGYRGFETSQAIFHQFGNGGTALPVVPVVQLPAGHTFRSAPARAQLATALGVVRHAVPSARIASYASTGDPSFLSADGRTTFALIYPPTDRIGNSRSDELARVRQSLAGRKIEGSAFAVTGIDALTAATGKSSGGVGVLAETIIGGGGAFLVLAFVFASFLAIVPLLMAVVAIPTTFLLIWPLASLTNVSFIVEFLVGLIGLGVAIDYSLLVVMRWREERIRGLDNDAAVTRAIETAGSAVIFSGTTVAIGLLALVALPVPFLSSVGYAGFLIPLVSVAVALTLLPVLLSSLGPKLDRPRRRRHDRASQLWTWWAKRIVRFRWLGGAAAAAVLVALVVSALPIQLGTAAATSIATRGPAVTGLNELTASGIGTGVLQPLEVLTRPSAAKEVAAALAGVHGVRSAVAPAARDWRRGGAAIVDVLPINDPATTAGHSTLADVRKAADDLPAKPAVGGSTALASDFVSAVYGSFPLMIGLIALVTFALLAHAFRSILLPLKAVALNVVSVAASWGVMVLVWQKGHGSHLIWSLPATHSITAWVPLMVFAFLYGLSMDYEVFILARMREEYDATGSTEEAVIRGMGRTGRLVTSAALILFLAFVSMSSAPNVDVKVLATGLAAGILLDATVVRGLLVPALVSLFGRWNWWMPHRAARLLRVDAHPAAQLQE